MAFYRWLRRMFGKCHERWRHSWRYNKYQDRRVCNYCYEAQRKVGEYQLDSDLGSIPAWETYQLPAEENW